MSFCRVSCLQPGGVQTIGTGQAVWSMTGSGGTGMEGQSSAARSYGRLRHRIKGNGRKGPARISGRGILKMPYVDGFLLSQEVLKNSVEGIVWKAAADPDS